MITWMYKVSAINIPVLPMIKVLGTKDVADGCSFIVIMLVKEGRREYICIKAEGWALYRNMRNIWLD